MNVLLVYPWYLYSSVSTFEEPLGILYLASALLETRHKVYVADLTFKQKLNGLKEKACWADLVGISAPTPLLGTAAAVLGHIKEINPDIHSVIGGPHATADPADALRVGFDVAVIGEGEVTLVELVETIGERTPLDRVAGIAYFQGEELRFTPPRPFIRNVDEIPLPARQFIDYSRYRRLGIISMRGCPYRCLFCKPMEDKLFGKKLRKRSLESVVEEINEVIARYGNRQISFKDDTLTVNKTEWFQRLGEQLHRRSLRLSWQCSSRVDTVDFHKLKAMKEAGCRQIFFGIESGSQQILDYYHKDITVEQIVETFAMCHRVGIWPCASIMLGAPLETREDLEKTYQLVKTIKPYNWHVHVTTPICGTYLYDRARTEGRLKLEDDYSIFEPTGNLYRLRSPMKLDDLSADDIAEYRNRINRYMKFRVLLRTLLDLTLWKEFLLSRGLRTIAYNFFLRHFNIISRLASRWEYKLHNS
ncbi:MAG: radical SAM protein [candidate division Zixibacteria bacterium]|nr:radical SAM protein [candidate division Zixibacteria bacterium]